MYNYISSFSLPLHPPPAETVVLFVAIHGSMCFTLKDSIWNVGIMGTYNHCAATWTDHNAWDRLKGPHHWTASASEDFPKVLKIVHIKSIR